MKKEKIFMAVISILFVVVAALSLFVWHSWYLYYGAVLIYVVLVLLTIILKYLHRTKHHHLKKNVLFFVMCLFFFGCEDRKVQNFGQHSIFMEHCDTSAVWRVKMHSFGNTNNGYVAIALDNGKRFSIKFHDVDVTEDWMLLNEGDTIVYQGDQILSVIWKKH